MTNELIKKVKEGNELACKEIIDQFSLMIYSIINNFELSYGDYCVPIEDLYQEGCISLLEACKSYVDNNHTKFSTYAYVVIERKIKRTFNKLIKPYKEEFSIDKPVKLGHHSSTFHNYISDKQLRYDVAMKQENELINSLKYINEDDKKILALRVNDYSYKEIASILNIPEKSVDNRISRIRRRYRDLKEKNISFF